MHGRLIQFVCEQVGRSWECVFAALLLKSRLGSVNGQCWGNDRPIDFFCTGGITFPTYACMVRYLLHLDSQPKSVCATQKFDSWFLLVCVRLQVVAVFYSSWNILDACHSSIRGAYKRFVANPSRIIWLVKNILMSFCIAYVYHYLSCATHLLLQAHAAQKQSPQTLHPFCVELSQHMCCRPKWWNTWNHCSESNAMWLKKMASVWLKIKKAHLENIV